MDAGRPYAYVTRDYETRGVYGRYIKGSCYEDIRSTQGVTYEDVSLDVEVGPLGARRADSDVGRRNETQGIEGCGIHTRAKYIGRRQVT